MNQGEGAVPAARSESPPNAARDGSAPVFALDHELFLRMLVGKLADTLQDVIGMTEAAGFISVVGQRIGDQINAGYRAELARPVLNRPEVAEVLVDLKRRIDGDFRVVEQDDTRIVLENRRCPFGDKVIGRPSLCMMTSNVFGVIAAENLGEVKVELAETIAEGSSRCRVVVYLAATPQSEAAIGREYFKA